MTVAMREKTGIPKQRGFWLRCFLGGACFAMALFVVAGGVLWAKVEPPGPLHLWRLHGFFVTSGGKPVENVDVTLVRDGKVLYTTKTDRTGKFAFDHVRGRYSLHIDRSNDYSELSREVIVGLETATILRGNTLYIVAGPGACTDDCASVFTNKSDFERVIERNTHHHR
jgi:hypothetical protein